MIESMRTKSNTVVGALVLGLTIGAASVEAQRPEFKWVNPLPDNAHQRLSHGTFRSTSMGVDVGYVIYLPPGYDDPTNAARRYPVVYTLHGGLQGSESMMAGVAIRYVDPLIEAGTLPPRIHVFVNGGRYSHYDYRESLGETAFVKELIPHIDGTYRTIATRFGRAIEGFSAGGRGTARIVFEYPELFCSATPMSGGHQHEKMVSEGRGAESNFGIPLPREYNSWDRASRYAAGESAPELQILVVVGTEDRNYASNVAWMDHLESLGIPFESRIVPDVGHDYGRIFSRIGDEIVEFLERCFQRARGEQNST